MIQGRPAQGHLQDGSSTGWSRAITGIGPLSTTPDSETVILLVGGRGGVNPEMAVRLGKHCGNGPGLWLRMQQSYDLWKANQKLADELRLIKAHNAPVPAS